MKSDSTMDINALLKNGYFPEEIHPAFVTEDLENVISKVLPLLDTFDTINKVAKDRNFGKITKLLPFSIPKSKSYRRNIGIPNPLSFIRLCNTIVSSWPSITSFLEKSKISLSPIKPSVASNRSIMQPSFDEITKQRILRSTGNRFALKIDIQRFYGSIYTHSIPWAFHGKSISKTSRKRYELLGNELDEDIRKMQDGQTMGIPIGPDTSRIISEIITTYVDIKLQKAIKKIKAIRIVDDYTLYFKTLSELEFARATIFGLLKELELDLNQAKEKIIDLPEQIESDWYNSLRDFKFRNEIEFQKKDIIAYFDRSFYFSTKFTDDAILSYSISKISATIFKEESWQILEAFLLQSLFKDSRVLPYVVRLLISHFDEDYDLDFDLIEETFEDFLLYHFKLDNHYEVSWTLWLFKQLEIELSEGAAIEISKSQNAVVILTILDLNNSKLIPKGLDTTVWEAQLIAENLYNENWLLAYEVVVKGWLTPSTDYISDDPFFKLLSDNKVNFYKEDKEIDLSKIKVTSEDASLLKYKSVVVEKAEVSDDDELPDYNLSDYDLDF